MRHIELLHRTTTTLVALIFSITELLASHPTLSGGFGTYDDPYLISSATDLVALSKYVNDEGADDIYYYSMTEDIDMAGIDFEPINNYKFPDDGYGCFFEGNNHIVKNLTITKGNDYCGLFGKINGKHLYINNLNIEGLNIDVETTSPTAYVGGIVAYYSSSTTSGSCTINNCSVSGGITMNSYIQSCVGGIAGYCKYINITNCKNRANIKVEYGSVVTSQDNGVGGIVGRSIGTIQSSRSISNCCNYGNITGPTNIGGICGYTTGITASKNVNSGKITYFDDNAGGIIGYAYSTLLDFNCNIGGLSLSFEGIDDKSLLTTKYVGGIAGYSLVAWTVTATYPFADNLNMGYVDGWDYTGGVCGYSNGWTYNNVNVGAVSDGSAYIANCKSGANIACYPYSSGSEKNLFYGGALYDKQMSILTDSMNGMVFDDKPMISELYSFQMLFDSIHNHFVNEIEVQGPHDGVYDWFYNEGVYAMPNNTDLDFNLVASAVLRLDTADRINDVNHQFKISMMETIGDQPVIESASNNKICKIAGKTVGLVGTGKDTIRIHYKGIIREIPLVVNSVDTLVFSGGAGTKEDPYLLSCIKDINELAYIVNHYNHPKYPEKNWSYEKWFVLTDNIDESFTQQIGIAGEQEFQGHLDGNGKKITVNIESSVPVTALFTTASEPASIKNLEVNGEISNAKVAAALIGIAKNVEIEACLNTTNIVATDTAGGITAKAYNCNISACGNDGLIKSGKLSGGIVGYAENCTISDVVNGGSVLSAKTAGGLLGSTPGTDITTGVNYGYTGRTTYEIAGTNIGYAIGDKKNGTSSNLHWNAQTCTIWDETWETEGISSETMLTDPSFKSSLGETWFTESDTTLPVPNAIKDFLGCKLLTMPYTFSEKWNTLKDINDEISIPGKWFKGSSYQNCLAMACYEEKFQPNESGVIKPVKFGQDTLIFIYYYNGINNIKQKYTKIVPIFSSYGFASGGKGTKQSPYLISNSRDLNLFAKTIIDDYYCVDTIRNASWHRYFRQTTDISEIITSSFGEAGTQRYEWSGYYDGDGHSLRINISDTKNETGLFKTVAKGGSISNLSVYGQVEGRKNCGAIAGSLKENSSIVNCRNNANVNGTENVGGLAGYNYQGTISSCYNNATITGSNNIGGICGYSDNGSKNVDLLNLGTVVGKKNVGGIVGVADSCDVRRAINAGITEGEYSLGGIVGRYEWDGTSTAFIFECMNYGYVGNDATHNGSIVGENVNEGTNVTLCFYNNQLTTAKAIDGEDNEGFASGLNTYELIGNGLDVHDYFLSENWRFEDNKYPTPLALSGIEAEIIKSPALIAKTESHVNIGTEFNLISGKDVEWKSATNNLKVEDNSVSFNHSGIDTLIAYIGDVEKRQPLFITNGLFSGGNGSQSRPYRITCKKDMDDLAYFVNSNILETDKTKNWSEGLYFSLENDIPEDSVITEVIGFPETVGEMKYTHFGGIFLGHGHEITVNINGSGDNLGLFGYILEGVVDSLTINGSITGTSNVGGFVGYCEEGVLSSCNNRAMVRGNNDVGGVCGFVIDGTIINCNNSNDIISEENKAGGIVGEATKTTIEGCTNIGIISSYTLNSYSGGICGKMNNDCSLGYCFNGGIVKGENKVGGIVGEAMSCPIKECLSTNDIEKFGSADSPSLGRICGSIGGSTELTECYFDNQFTHIKKASDEEYSIGLSTTDMIGDKLSAALTGGKWLYETKMYPRPNNDTIALLAASTLCLQKKDNSKDISDEFEANTFTDCEWYSKANRVNVKETKVSLFSMGQDTMVASHNAIKKKVAIEIKCITLHNQDTIIGCDSVSYEGKIYYENTEFNDTLISKETGCDSLVGIRIIINHSSTAPKQPVIYALGEYEYRGVIYTNDTVVVTKLENSVGCDSIVEQEINIVNTKVKRDTVPTGCDSVLYNNVYYKADTVFEAHYKDGFDRDTLIQYTHLFVNNSVTVIADTIYGIDSVKVGNIYYGIGDTLIADTTLLETGCNHITKQQIHVGKTIRNNKKKTYCGDGTLTLSTGRIIVKENSIINDTTISNRDLVNIDIYNVTILEPKDTTIYRTSCDSIHFRGNIYTESIQLDSVYETEWCDSTVHYVLTVLKPTIGEQTISNCYVTKFRGVEYTENTMVYDTLQGMNHLGCDSIVATQIFVYKSTTDTLHTYGEEVKTVYGKDIYNDTTIVDTLVNQFGCDSLLVTEVHITHLEIDSINLYGCDSLVVDGGTYFTNTTLMKFYYNPIDAWDDIDKELKTYLKKEEFINLKIGKYQEYIKTIDSCDQITFNGKIYTSDTEIRDSFVSRTGCDSIMVYRLRLHAPKKEGVVNISGCGIATWDGENFYKDTTIYQELTTKWGCDSMCVVNIVVRHPDENSIIETGCNMVEYDGEQFKHDTTLTRVFTNQGGCDSTVHVKIEVFQPTYSTITYEGEYDVTYNGRKYTRSTVIRDTTVNKHGCDSIITVAIIVTKSLDYPIVVNKYGYMLLCNNNIGTDKYKQFQWYKNGVSVYGETKPYYSENKGEKLNGCYQVYVTTVDGREYFSEEICITEEKALQLYPNPASLGQDVTIEYDFSEKQKDGLYLDVYNSSGKKIYHDQPYNYPIVIPGQRQKGHYFILITTGEDKNMGTKFIVK